MSTLIWNLSYGLRALRKNLGLTAAVIATLTLGFGATTAIYTVVYATLLAPLPYPDPNQLIIVWSKVDGQRNGVSAGDFLDWQRQNTSFQQLVAWTNDVISQRRDLVCRSKRRGSLLKEVAAIYGKHLPGRSTGQALHIRNRVSRKVELPSPISTLRCV